jgi:hypothetical protein
MAWKDAHLLYAAQLDARERINPFNNAIVSPSTSITVMTIVSFKFQLAIHASLP